MKVDKERLTTDDLVKWRSCTQSKTQDVVYSISKF